MSDSVSSARATTSGSSARGAASGSIVSGPRESRAADLAYSTFYSGALGGSTIAVLFLVLDAVRGQPLFTPSLLGTALFTGVDPATVSAIRLDMVAYFSVVHFAAFFALGGIASRLYLDARAFRGRTFRLAALLFFIMTGALLIADQLLMAGAASGIGMIQILLANAGTAAVMARFVEGALGERIA